MTPACVSKALVVNKKTPSILPQNIRCTMSTAEYNKRSHKLQLINISTFPIQCEGPSLLCSLVTVSGVKSLILIQETHIEKNCCVSHFMAVDVSRG